MLSRIMSGGTNHGTERGAFGGRQSGVKQVFELLEFGSGISFDNGNG